MIYEKNYMPLKNILKFKKEKKDIKIINFEISILYNNLTLN